MPRRRPPSVEDLVQEGARLVREYAHVETSKTALLRDLARVVVELRSRFHTEDGRVDWAGRSHPYRETVARIYAEANLPPDSLSGVQAALRYHIGNVLREVAPADELEDLGLKSATPRERVKETRDRTAALARAALVQETPSGNVRADVARLVSAADVLLSKVSEADLAALPEDRLATVRATLESVSDRAHVLLALTSPTQTGERRRRRILKAV